MKSCFSIILGAMLAAPCALASINLDFRADYRGLNYNTDAATKGSSAFNFKTGRIDYQGKLSDDISFRTRLAFTKDATTTTGTTTTTTNDAGLQKAVEFAFVANKLSDSFTLTVGRYASEMGAFEGTTAGPDLYMTSAGYSGSGATGALGASTATKVSATNPYLYITGAKVSYQFVGQELIAQAANPVVTGNDGAQSRMLSGLVYKGGFLDKTLNIIGSYHTVGIASATQEKDENVTFAALGVTYLFADNLIGMDNLMNAYKRNAGGTDSRTENTATMNVTYAYKGLETITPMLKYTQTTETPDSTTAVTAPKTVVTGASAVVEFKPIKEQNVRYHVAYSNLSNKVDGATTTPSQTEILVGMRLNADFLK